MAIAHADLISQRWHGTAADLAEIESRCAAKLRASELAILALAEEIDAERMPVAAGLKDART